MILNTCDARRRVIQAASKAIEKIHLAAELFYKEYVKLEEEVTKQAEELEKQVHEHTNQQVREIQFQSCAAITVADGRLKKNAT